MRCLRITDGATIYIVNIRPANPDSLSELFVESCWLFYPGRIDGRKISLTSLPWHARQIISDAVGTSTDSPDL